MWNHLWLLSQSTEVIEDTKPWWDSVFSIAFPKTVETITEYCVLGLLGLAVPAIGVWFAKRKKKPKSETEESKSAPPVQTSNPVQPPMQSTQQPAPTPATSEPTVPKTATLLTDGQTSVNAQTFLYRDEIVQKVETALLNRESSQLVSGFGGIGKTTIARKVFHDLRNQFDFVGWVPYNGNLDTSLCNAFLSKVLYNIENTDIENTYYETTKQKTEDVWKFIRKYAHKTLLIIDNVDKLDKDEEANLDKLAQQGVAVLITSRLTTGISGYNNIPVDFLSPEQCVEVFYRYYNDNNATTQKHLATVQSLVKWAQYHTLTVELLAKSAKPYGIPAFYRKLEQNGVHDLTVNDSTDPAKSVKVEQHLKALFDLSSEHLTDEQRRILQNLALLPSVEMSADELQEWIKADVNNLQSLRNSGWLEFHEDQKTGFYLHPLIHQVIELSKDTSPNNIGEEFVKLLAKGRYSFVKENETYETILPKLEIGYSLLSNVKAQGSLEYTSACHHLAQNYYEMGDYPISLELYERLVNIQRTPKCDSSTLANIYNDMGLLYWSTGNFEQAVHYHNLALCIRKKCIPANPVDIATSHHNLANVYWSMGNLSDAESNHQTALNIRIDCLGDDHPDTASSYNNLALIYRANKQLEKACASHLKSLSIRKCKLGIRHPDTAHSYNNLGLVYQNTGKLIDALILYKKALKIKNKIFPSNHPDTAVTYYNLGSLHHDMKKVDVAIDWMLKAYTVFLYRLEANHPQTKTSLNDLKKYYPVSTYSDSGQSFDAWLAVALPRTRCELGIPDSN